MSVVVYITPTCGFCRQVKAYLHQRGVPFTEYDVSPDPRAAAEMVRLSGQRGVPVVLIDDQGVEVKSFELYSQSAKEVEDPAARQMFQRLAAAERQHFDILMLRYESRFGYPR